MTIPFHTAVRLEVYARFLESGKAVRRAEIARKLRCTEDEVRGAFALLAAEHALVLDPDDGEVRMAMPFSADPTAYRVRAEFGAGAWWANCAWDAYGVAALLDRDVQIETRCPVSGERIELAVRDGAPVPDTGIVHFAVPASLWWADIGFT